MATNPEKHTIFDKPLPVLLDEINVAAADARKAADDAKAAGEAAADEVLRKLRKVFMKMARDITEALEK
ncbi:MAG: hypothetical protein Q8O05_03025 [Chloroflexota bacterium]|nr:hypothetical protein [Chloroflexota bacterium]